MDRSRNLYIAESGNNRIQKFDESRRFLLKWGTFGTGDGELDWPEDVAVSRDGRVYVVDTDNQRIRCNFQTDTAASRSLGSGVTLAGSATVFL